MGTVGDRLSPCGAGRGQEEGVVWTSSKVRDGVAKRSGLQARRETPGLEFPFCQLQAVIEHDPVSLPFASETIGEDTGYLRQPSSQPWSQALNKRTYVNLLALPLAYSRHSVDICFLLPSLPTPTQSQALFER